MCLARGWGVSRGRATESRPLRQRLKQSPHNILAASSWKGSFPENSIVFQIFSGKNVFVFCRKRFRRSIEAVKLPRCNICWNRTQAGSHTWLQKRQFLQFSKVNFQDFTHFTWGSIFTVTNTMSLVPMIGLKKNVF